MAIFGAPYNLSCADQIELPELLEAPVSLRFVTMQGKHCGDEAQSGCFTALSENEAILKTDCPLAAYDNIRVDAGGELFAKVIRAEEDGFLLRFTSMPAGYGAWIRERCAK